MTEVANQTLLVLKAIQADLADFKRSTIEGFGGVRAELGELRGDVAGLRGELVDLRETTERGFKTLFPIVGGLQEAVADLSGQVSMLSRGVTTGS